MKLVLRPVGLGMLEKQLSKTNKAKNSKAHNKCNLQHSELPGNKFYRITNDLGYLCRFHED